MAAARVVTAFDGAMEKGGLAAALASILVRQRVRRRTAAVFMEDMIDHSSSMPSASAIA
jgi:hypothetical protein